MKEYKKNYIPFILMFIIYIILLIFVIPAFVNKNIHTEEVKTMIFLVIPLLFVEILFLVIHFGDYIYYYTFTDFDEAKKRTKEQREETTKAILKISTKAILVAIIGIIISSIFGNKFIEIIGVLIYLIAIFYVIIKADKIANSFKSTKYK